MLDKYYQVKGKDFYFAGEIEEADRLIAEVDQVTSIIPYVSENDIKEAERFLKNNTVLKEIANESDVSTEALSDVFATIKQFFKRVGKILVKIWNKIVTIIVKLSDYLGGKEAKIRKQTAQLKDEGYMVIRVGDYLIYYLADKNKDAKLNTIDPKVKEQIDVYTDGLTSDPETTVGQAQQAVKASKKDYQENNPDKSNTKKLIVKNTQVFIPEEHWGTFAFDPKFKPFTPNQLKEFKSLIDYQYRQMQEDSDNLSLTPLINIVKGILHSVRENLKGPEGKKIILKLIQKDIGVAISKTPRWRGEMLVNKDTKVSSSANLATINEAFGLPNNEFSKILNDVMVLKIEQLKDAKVPPYSKEGYSVEQVKAYLTELESLSTNLNVVVKNMSEICEQYKTECVNKSDKDIVELLKVTNPNAELHIQAGIEIIQLVTSNFYKSTINDIKMMRNLQVLIDTQVKALSRLKYKLKV